MKVEFFALDENASEFRIPLIVEIEGRDKISNWDTKIATILNNLLRWKSVISVSISG